MKTFNYIKGQIGESVAIDFLKDKKYAILETNFKTKIGEIDIIAKQNNVYVFVEVKARNSAKFGLPREAVTKYKQNIIRKVAMLYVLKHKLQNKDLRFDVIEILGDKIEHIIGCF